MFNNSSKILFFSILLMGTMITVSANSWLAAWMGLEINLLAFIPLMSGNNLMSTEASFKYFLVQALASTVLLFAVILFMLENKVIFQFKMNIYTDMMILSSLLLKSGSAPFHFWFPNVIEGLTWMNSLILMTWQKIAPMMLMSYVIVKPLILISAIASLIIGSLGGLNQTSLRKLMAFSSINHLSWMLASMYISETLWWTYFMFYSFLSMNLILLFNMYKIFHMNQLFNLFFSSKILKFTLFFNLLSLGGLPPFLGFLPKWIVIQSLIINNQLFLIFLMTTLTLIALFFYLRLCYTTFMLNYNENTWLTKINFNKISMTLYLIFSFFSIFGFFIISTFIML